MEIRIECFGYLANYSPTGEKGVVLALRDGAMLRDLLEKLDIPPEIERICLINGGYFDETKVLRQGDLVSLYPMLDGG
jgi:hypothetical protein